MLERCAEAINGIPKANIAHIAIVDILFIVGFF
jgi:hypothetical protein